MNIRKELINIITNGEESSLDKDTISLLELILKEKTLYDLKRNYCKEAFEYMRKDLNFVTFYFRYNMYNSYDTIIDLGSYNKTRREITLTYNNGIFKILKEEVLTDKEKETIYKNIDFYKELTMFAIENYYPRKEIKTTSRKFNINLFNDEIILSDNCVSFSISYLYDTEELKLGENAIEIHTNNFFVRRLLEKNDYENLIKLLENIKLYEKNYQEILTRKKQNIKY